MKKCIITFFVFALALQGVFADAITDLNGNKTTETEVTFDLSDGESGLNKIKIDFTETDPESYISNFDQTELTSSDGVTLTLNEDATKGVQKEGEKLYIYWQIVSGSPLKIELSGEKMTGTTPSNSLDWKTSWKSKTSSGDGDDKTLGASGASPAAADYTAQLVYQKAENDAVRQSGYTELTMETADIAAVKPDTYKATLTLTVTDTSVT